MNWRQIKQSIVEDLSSRGLKDPKIRLRALDNIEYLLQTFLPEYIQNPEKFNVINKEDLKTKLSKAKGRNLNSAEISCLNEIYYRVRLRQKVVTCPKCNQILTVAEEAQNERYLACLICGESFKDPMLPISHKNDNTRVAIGGIVLLIMLLFFIGKCSNGSQVEAYVAAKNFVKTELVSPATAKFPASASADVIINNSGNEYTISGYVDSQNGFGAVIRNHYTVKMELHKDGRWLLINLHFR